MRILIGAVAVMLLAGCLDENKRSDGLTSATKQTEGIQIAANSPDAAIKSWWAVKDAGMNLDREICFEYTKMKSAATDKLKSLASDDLPMGRDCFQDILSFDRKIAKVEVESDTRAVVLATIKNTTPPESGAEMSDSDRKAKESGERYRYTLERKDSASNWKISRIENYPSYARDWQDAYTKPKPSNNQYVYEQLQ